MCDCHINLEVEVVSVPQTTDRHEGNKTHRQPHFFYTDPSRYHGEPDVAQKNDKNSDLLAAEELSTTLISV